VARSHTARDCSRDAEDSASSCAGVEEGEAVDYCLDGLVGMVEKRIFEWGVVVVGRCVW
jgi:hypothetical protein